MDDRDLDTAIDVVARQMTAGEPDAGFRARVLARIEAGFGSRDSGVGSRDSGLGPRDSGFGRWRWAVGALGAAAMIVVAVVVFRNEAPADRGTGPGVQTTRSAVSSAAPARSAGPEGPALQPRVDSQPRGATVRLPPSPLRGYGGPGKADTTSTVRLKADTTYREALKPGFEIDALAPPPLTPFPLDVASIAVDALPPADSIQLDKLEIITPIAVAPLGEGDRP
jgi:hypothetical protein